MEVLHYFLHAFLSFHLHFSVSEIIYIDAFKSHEGMGMGMATLLRLNSFYACCGTQRVYYTNYVLFKWPFNLQQTICLKIKLILFRLNIPPPKKNSLYNKQILLFKNIMYIFTLFILILYSSIPILCQLTGISLYKKWKVIEKK